MFDQRLARGSTYELKKLTGIMLESCTQILNFVQESNDDIFQQGVRKSAFKEQLFTTSIYYTTSLNCRN